MIQRAYYNDNNHDACEWLRNLIAGGVLPEGDVDERSIAEVQPGDLVKYTQCHFFAGIGGWPLALLLAEWPQDKAVWTGSCPCQPFSNAGQRKGESDERHLWPEFYRLITARRPEVVFGEQVASKDGRDWLAGVETDLSNIGYQLGGADIPAAAMGAPNIRQRLYWVAKREEMYGLQTDQAKLRVPKLRRAIQGRLETAVQSMPEGIRTDLAQFDLAIQTATAGVTLRDEPEVPSDIYRQEQSIRTGTGGWAEVSGARLALRPGSAPRRIEGEVRGGSLRTVRDPIQNRRKRWQGVEQSVSGSDRPEGRLPLQQHTSRLSVDEPSSGQLGARSSTPSDGRMAGEGVDDGNATRTDDASSTSTLRQPTVHRIRVRMEGMGTAERPSDPSASRYGSISIRQELYRHAVAYPTGAGRGTHGNGKPSTGQIEPERPRLVGGPSSRHGLADASGEPSERRARGVLGTQAEVGTENGQEHGDSPERPANGREDRGLGNAKVSGKGTRHRESRQGDREQEPTGGSSLPLGLGASDGRMADAEGGEGGSGHDLRERQPDLSEGGRLGVSNSPGREPREPAAEAAGHRGTAEPTGGGSGLADTDKPSRRGRRPRVGEQPIHGLSKEDGGLEHPESDGRVKRRAQPIRRSAASRRGDGGLGNADEPGRQGRGEYDGEHADERPLGAPSADGGLAHAERDGRRANVSGRSEEGRETTGRTRPRDGGLDDAAGGRRLDTREDQREHVQEGRPERHTEDHKRELGEGRTVPPEEPRRLEDTLKPNRRGQAGFRKAAWAEVYGPASWLGRSGRYNAWWNYLLVPCADGKVRRISAEPGDEPLASGVPARLVKLRGYGNAISPPLAAEFVSAYMDVQKGA